MTTASAPGKVILCGEHAVVYGQPAIALPLPEVRAQATVEAAAPDAGIRLNLADLGESVMLREAQDHPLATLIRLVIEELQVTQPLDLLITLRSAIPIASGMGSGAALGAALVKALSAQLGRSLDPGTVSRLVYESERFYHGTPSGIDNTVVSYEQAIWFVRGQEQQGRRTPPTIEPLRIGAPFALVIGDTGVHAPTHITVGRVRERWQQEPQRFDRLFNEIGQVVAAIRQQLAAGDLPALGAALNRNQDLLHEIGVSSPELERLITGAREVGALGAKLSGGGGG
ncbi:MAG: mevalonate kinase, partial [Chloroflexi bacterium]|nr:mevalonate kinase [Chloroflexota bacterium]